MANNDNLLVLTPETNSYYVNHPRDFVPYGTISNVDKFESFEFAYDMSYGKKGAHRAHRSGGSNVRAMGEIFINAFQGKLAEYALYRYFEKKNIYMKKPDTSVFKLGQWDSFDLECQGKHISVKSTKSYGNLLLLETADWNDEGEYKPNKESGASKYDYTVLVRFKPDGEDLMKQNKLLYQKDEEIPEDIKGILIEKIRNVYWTYDFPGFIFYTELVKMIRDKQILPKEAMLNGSTKMDAENYYYQTGKMHPLSDSFTLTERTKTEHSSDLLERECPECGKKLHQKNSSFIEYWECDCGYKEPIEL